MRIIRRPEPVPVVEPVVAAEPPRAEPIDLERLAAPLRDAVDAMREIASREHPAPQVTVHAPASAARPSAFTVTITKRDESGRVSQFDVRVKGDEERPDAFTEGYESVKRQ